MLNIYFVLEFLFFHQLFIFTYLHKKKTTLCEPAAFLRHKVVLFLISASSSQYQVLMEY